jgi:hypothetical protein
MAQRPSQADATTPVTAERVEALAVGLLRQTWSFGWDGYRYGEADLYRVLLAAAVQQQSVTSICGQFTASPSANWIWHVLRTQLLDDVDPDTLEAELNDLLWRRLPPGLSDEPLRVVIDLTLRPYYGKAGAEPGQLRRGAAKAGTTRFHGYATAYALRAGARVTLALSFVWAEEALADVLTDLVGRLQARGVRLSRLDLDRGFAAVAILRWLAEQPFLSVVAVPKRGRRLKALLAGSAPIQTTYTMSSADDGDVTFPLWIAYEPPDGEGTKPAYLPFAVLGPRPADLDVAGVAEPYRERFGVEARYRQANEVRVRTTSRDPRYRLLLVGLACLLTNLWVVLQATLVAAVPPALRAAARDWISTHARLATVRALLFAAIADRYQIIHALAFPFPLAAPPKL